MPTVASFTERAPLIAADLPVSDVAERFAAHPAAHALAVAEDGVIIGLIPRPAVERALRQNDGSRTAKTLILDEPLAIEASSSLTDAIHTILADPARANVFVTVEDGLYAGVGALRDLIPALMSQAQRPVSEPAPAVAEEMLRLLHSAEVEFRAQVQGLLAMTDRLARQHLSPDAHAQVISIKSTGERLLRLADDAKDMLHARQGRLELTLANQPLRDLMDQVQERWIARAAEVGVGLLISYDGDPDLSAMIDADRLTQVFDSLIDNALRYTRHGSVEAALRARVEGDQVVLEGRVRDTGPGLAAQRLARIFEAEPGPDGESGSLPLSLSRGIVHSMRGAIRAESNVGQGMTIVFDLMVAMASKAAAPAEAARPVSGAPHVLVVDDNATNRMVAEALCEMFECTSETAEDGVEAVEAARSGRFDLILMDIKMPRMDGIAATRAIRDLEGAAGRAPIVALTANVDPEDARSYLAAGMCCVVEKPIKPDRLLQAINIALSAGESEAQRVAAA